MITTKLGDDDAKLAVISSWEIGCENHGALITVQEDLLSNASEWFLVRGKDTGMNLAVFDIRSVPPRSPSFHKSLRIHLAPQLGLGIDSQDFSEIEEVIKKVTSIFAKAFACMIETAEGTKKRLCKIHCAHTHELVIFRAFVSYLTENFPEQYSGKFYGKWIEIQSIN